jgi:hypothetical protein
MNVSRAGVTGVSLPTDQRMIDARFLSRRIISASCRFAFARVEGFSQSIVQ